MTILDTILAHKREEVLQAKETVSTSQLEQLPGYNRPRYSLKAFVANPQLSGIIAEFKRKSPSRGIINGTATVAETTQGYMHAGVSGLSILTDEHFFGGTLEDLAAGRAATEIPILRKDFVIDEYQIVEARAWGADAILLIAAALEPELLLRLAKFAHSIEMEVLMEVHNREELDRSLNDHLDLVGVNNRNLKDFTVDIHTSLQLAEYIPEQFVRVAESGLSDPREVVRLRLAGYQGFLMGQRFMETSHPATACEAFVAELNSLSPSNAPS